MQKAISLDYLGIKSWNNFSKTVLYVFNCETCVQKKKSKFKRS
jgi:hypothetical protein